MSSQLVCRPQKDLPVAVLRVSGTLDQVTGDALQQSVRRSLALQPEQLLIDVGHLHIGDPLGLAAFGAVVCQTVEWPNVPIVLCGADRRTEKAIAADPDCGRLSFAADGDAAFAAAMAEAGARPAASTIRVRLRPVPDACRQVRGLVAQACAAWCRSDLAATAALIATELVANVVRHAHTTMEFTFAVRDGRVDMTVRDHSRTLPKAADPAVRAVGGRGLRLVRDLSEAWGVLPVTDGKVVWSRLATA
ncbi:ATP-binding protein [Actinoplanes sp. NPDC051411]|uniref:ATP-binding protein n=1 Tax=Actinoplanes sp. NPDC051411 TaxID=3155522 RepID=UPI0034446B5B